MTWLRMNRGTVLLLLLCRAVQAAPRGGQPPSSGRTIVKFDGDTIDGNLLRPDGDLMAGRPEIPMPNLVQPPRSFQRAERHTLLAAAASVEKTTVKPVAESAAKAHPMKDGGAAGSVEGSDGGRGDRSSGGAR